MAIWTCPEARRGIVSARQWAKRVSSLRLVRVNLNLGIQGPADISSSHLVPVSLSNLIAVIWPPPLALSYSLPTSLNMPYLSLPLCLSRYRPITQSALPHICFWHSPANWLWSNLSSNKLDPWGISTPSTSMPPDRIDFSFTFMPRTLTTSVKNLTQPSSCSQVVKNPSLELGDQT